MRLENRIHDQWTIHARANVIIFFYSDVMKTDFFLKNRTRTEQFEY